MSEGKIFGETKMTEEVADIADMTNILQHGALKVDRFPEDAVEDMIVQLVSTVTDDFGVSYIAGHYYKCKIIDKKQKWVDITAYVSKSTTQGVCEYSYDENRVVHFSVINPSRNESGAPLFKTLFYIVDKDSNSKVIEEQEIYTIGRSEDGSVPETAEIDVTIDDDGSNIEDMNFMVEFMFSDGTTSRCDCTLES